MEKDESFEIYEGIVVPESPLLKREHSNRYGSVPGLDDEELIEPAEILQQALTDAITFVNNNHDSMITFGIVYQHYFKSFSFFPDLNVTIFLPLILIASPV